MTADDHPDHIEEQSEADAWVDAERREFWRRIHRMSSATYQPTRTSSLFGSFSVDIHHGRARVNGNAATRGYPDRRGR